MYIDNMLLRTLQPRTCFVQRRLLHPAYVIFPNTRAQEQEKQACYLTNTIVQDDFINKRDSTVLSDLERDEIVAAMRRSIIEVNYFHRDEEVSWKKMTKDTMIKRLKSKFKAQYSTQIIFNFLKVLWCSNIESTSGLLSSSMSFRPDIVAPWERDEQKLQVCGKHGHLVRGKSLLPIFANADEIEETRNVGVIWDDIISPFFDLHQYPSKFIANQGFHQDSPYPCPQTLLITNPQQWTSRVNTGQGVFYSFAHALTYAVNNGEHFGEDLKQPVPMQCIIFNGTSLFFIRYQLNTLNFTKKDGVKNMAWIISDEKLYDEVTTAKTSASTDYVDYTSERVSLVDYNRKKLSETFKNEQTERVFLEGFNRNAVDLFIDFMLYPQFEKQTS